MIVRSDIGVGGTDSSGFDASYTEGKGVWRATSPSPRASSDSASSPRKAERTSSTGEGCEQVRRGNIADAYLMSSLPPLITASRKKTQASGGLHPQWMQRVAVSSTFNSGPSAAPSVSATSSQSPAGISAPTNRRVGRPPRPPTGTPVAPTPLPHGDSDGELESESNAASRHSNLQVSRKSHSGGTQTVCPCLYWCSSHSFFDLSRWGWCLYKSPR